MKILRIAKLFVLLILLGSTFGVAQDKQHVQADLLSEMKTIQPGHPFWVAVRLKMNPQWHTYWKNPGDSGIPTKFKWTLPEGFQAGPILWPAPKRIELPPLTSFGYEDTAYLLTEITPPPVLKSTKDVLIGVHVDWLECKESCLPGKADLSIKLPVSIKPPIANPTVAGNFSLARFALPINQSEWLIKPSQDAKFVTFEMDAPGWYKNESPKIEFFPDHPDLIENAAPQKIFRANNHWILKIPKPEVSTQTHDSLAGVLVADMGWMGPQTETALALNLPLPTQASSYSEPQPKSASRSLWIVFLFAFFGGVLLNLMPCVLPVLSIKVMGFIGTEDTSRVEKILNGLLYTLGVLLTFWGLAGIILFLKNSGQSVGWGFQLQSPVFVASLICLFFVLALNLFGLFEIGLSFGRFGTIGASSSRRVSAFISGIFATIVATPCTAPFMGSALGYALVVPAYQSFLIFSFLGLGMAAPYILLTAFPALLKFVPKPGAWMDTFKQAMGFLFLATVLWLLWVFAQQQNQSSLLMILGALFIFSLAGWMYGKFQINTKPIAKRIWILLALIFIAVGAQVVFKASQKVLATKNTVGEELWEPYSEQAVEFARKEGRHVFVDFSAAWCLTCQVNERVVLSSEDVLAKFKEKNVALFRADWTSKDETITKVLNALGRNGVPVYALYAGGSSSDPVLLPEILTPTIVIDALNKLN